MAAQDEPPIRIVDTAAGPLIPKGQTTPVTTDDSAIDFDDRPGRNDSLVERFLYNLRVALSAPHS